MKRKKKLVFRERKFNELRRFLHDITLELQSHRNKSSAQMDDMFQKAYSLYVKYDCENFERSKPK